MSRFPTQEQYRAWNGQWNTMKVWADKHKTKISRMEVSGLYNSERKWVQGLVIVAKSEDDLTTLRGLLNDEPLIPDGLYIAVIVEKPTALRGLLKYRMWE